MADISKITLPSGSTYDIKDAVARGDIATLSAAIQGGVHYIGKTTTALSDGSTTNPVTIGGESVTAKQGDMVSMAKAGSQDVEFIFNGSTWYELGSTGSLKALAFADSATGSTTYTPEGTFSANLANGAVEASGTFTPEGSVSFSTEDKTVSTTYTPAGTVSQPEFQGNVLSSEGAYTPAGGVTTASTETLTATISVGEGAANYTPAGSVSQPTFSGDSMTATGTFTPAGSVSFSNSNVTTTVAAAEGDATYTPAGSVAAPTISIATAGSTTTIHDPTAATVVTNVDVANPSETAAEGELVYCSVSNETLSLSKFTATTGASITTSDVTVKTGDAAYEASAPAFTGTGARLVTGNISVPLSASFSGSEGNVSVTGTPEGTVSQPTFSGTGVNLVNSGIAVPKTYTFSGTEAILKVSGTPSGTVSQPTFSGTQATISSEVEVPTSATFTGSEGGIDVAGTATGSVSGSISGTEATISITATPTV